MKHKRGELWLLLEHGAERPVENEITHFKEVPHRVKALKGKVVRVVACFALLMGPVDESGARGFTNFLLLFVEALLSKFFPSEAEIVFSRN